MSWPRTSLPAGMPTPEISVIDSDTVNAFAAPGGQIGIFRGLIDEARSPAELAGVLAHEMGHVIKRHPSEAMVRSAGYSILVAALVGDTSSAMQIAARTGETLLNLAHSRSAEAEADRTAELMLNRAGYDSSGLDTFLTRIGQGARRNTPGTGLSRQPPADPGAGAVAAQAGTAGGFAADGGAMAGRGSRL